MAVSRQWNNPPETLPLQGGRFTITIITITARVDSRVQCEIFTPAALKTRLPIPVSGRNVA